MPEDWGGETSSVQSQLYAAHDHLLEMMALQPRVWNWASPTAAARHVIETGRAVARPQR